MQSRQSEPSRSELLKKRLLIAAVAVLVIPTLVWIGAVSELSATAPDNAAPSGWGAEALINVQDAVGSISPIADANACGMGASSCFKCHNGTRAVAPSMDKKSGLWHLQHKTVNGSCAGCHKGKQRLIKKELAHEGLIKDPRLAVADTCDSCHKSGNSGELNKQYQ